MKRLIAVILAAVLALAVVPAVGETTWEDWFAQYRDEDLEDIASMIRTELARRNVGPLTLDPGIYVVGTDFPQGIYRAEAVSDFPTSLYLFVSQEAFSMTDYFFGHLFYGNDSPVGRVYLTTGCIIEITGSAVRFSPFTGIE